MRNKDKMITRFTALFVFFSVVLIVLFACVEYQNETKTYNNMKLQQIRNVNNYLESIIRHDKEDYIKYIKYLDQYHDKMEVPYEFSEYDTALAEFNLAFDKAFPDKLFGVDILIDDLPEDLLLMYLVYDYEYWTITFQDARDEFGLVYAYLIKPDSSDGTVTYIVDAVRDEKPGKPGMFDVYAVDAPEDNPFDEVRVMWETWEKGVQLDEFQEWDNQYGHNYTCYTPLYMDEDLVGLICTEVEVDSINSEILVRSVRHASILGLLIILSFMIMLLYVERRYLKRLSLLTEGVKEYSNNKDVSVAEKIKKLAIDHTEVGELAAETSDMIIELDNHMKSLTDTNRELDESKKREADAKNLAMKDTLTGIRNKAAYDEVCKKLDSDIPEGFAEFGVGMVDLNYLKRINDSYGHDKGNVALVKLSGIICNIFKHSPVFRVGGDEFIIILMGEDFDHLEEREEQFKNTISEIQKDTELEEWERVSAAIGVSKFTQNDKTVDDVFKRADEAMYKEKTRMKAVRIS